MDNFMYYMNEDSDFSVTDISEEEINVNIIEQPTFL